ncbi:MAG: deoxynucleoside kinase [Bradymonadales bacterium]|nr:deoxynucleoside kinase [Bradymonadales bacterium]
MKRTYYIVVEGAIGVGKTTLVQRLAERLRCRTCYEVFEENPFLADFYSDRDRYAFQTEMFFLLSRFRQQEEFSQADLFRPYTISDYLWDKSRLFAKQTLSQVEFGLFDHVFQICSRSIPTPDLVIYLHAPLDVLMERIQDRGRPYERDMEREYIANLCEVYQEFFKQYRQAPLASIDTTDLNFATSDRAIDLVIRLLHERPTDRVYLPTGAPALFE